MNNIVWIDLETTGLDFENDVILEIACIITDSQCNEIDSYTSVINHPDSILNAMYDWCKHQHSKSGLINDVCKSNITIQEAQDNTL